MNTIAALHEKIVQRERIELAGTSNTTIPFVFFLLFTTIGTIVNILIFSSQGFGIPFLASTGFFLAGSISILSLIWKAIGAAYIKGDMLIVKYLFGKSKVTELRSIRAIKTTKLLGFRLTSIRYKIDGEIHKVLIFGSTNYIHDPKMIIETVRKVA
jgi:hypothetical protein